MGDLRSGVLSWTNVMSAPRDRLGLRLGLSGSATGFGFGCCSDAGLGFGSGAAGLDFGCCSAR